MPSLKNATRNGGTVDSERHLNPSSLAYSMSAIATPIDPMARLLAIVTSVIETGSALIGSGPVILVPALWPAQPWARIVVPALRPVEAPMAVVVLRRQLPLIARRQILPILPVLRIWAARIVLIRPVFDAIATAIRLVDPDATRGIGVHRGRKCHAEQQRDCSDVHQAPPE